MNKKMVLVDGSSLLFRAFYAIPHLSTREGIMTNAVYGFLKMFDKVQKDYNPDYIMVAFDLSAPTFRHKKYEDYKGTRQKAPEELSHQFGLVKEVLTYMGIPVCEKEGYEADDIIGTVAKAFSGDVLTFLVTGDRDYFQLIDDRIQVILTRQGMTRFDLYDQERIKQEYGITPGQMIEVKALMGDSSDNIPGVPGIGEKTALKFIQKYHNLEELYEHVDEISGQKTKERLRDNKDLAYLSRELGTIDLAVPLDVSREALSPQKPNAEKLNALLDRLEIRDFHYKEHNASSNETEKWDVEFIEEFTKEQYQSIKKSGVFYVQIYYDEEIYIAQTPCFITFMTDHKIYLWSGEKGREHYHQLLQDNAVLKCGYFTKSLIYDAFCHGIEVEQTFEDLSIAQYLLDPAQGQDDPAQMARIYLDRTIQTLEDLRGKGKNKRKFLEIPQSALRAYFGEVLPLLPVLRELMNERIAQRQMTRLYRDIEMPLVICLASMEYEGFSIDKEILEDLGDQYREEAEEKEKEIYALAGEHFNIQSPKQLGEILFEKLQLPIIKKTKTGYSTAQDVLDRLRDKHPIIERIERYRQLTKLSSTYIDSLLNLIDRDGKIHTTFEQNLTATGRISSREPNLQNIPIRTGDGRLIRKAFIAEKGYKLVDADYSQIELRVLAHLSEDKKMIRAFQENADIHRQTASEVFKTDYDQVRSEQRSAAKAVNFGIVYGVSDYGLSQNLNISRIEAKEYITKYLETYPGIKAYMENIVKKAKEDGYVETLEKRRRYIPELQSGNFNIRSFGERVALNTPIQGSAADIIKLAMVQTYRQLKEKGLKARLILQIHDELIVRAPENEVELVENLVRQVMENVVKLKLPLKVDIDISDDWYV